MSLLPDRRRVARLAEKRALARQNRVREREAAELPGRQKAAFLREYLRRTAWNGTILVRHFPPEDACPALDRAIEIAGAAALLLEALGDTPDLRRADEALVEEFDEAPPFAELAAAWKPYYAGKPLDRDGASLVELVAWCLFKHGRLPLGEVVAWPDGTQLTVAAVP